LGIKAAELVLHRKERFRIGNRGIDLQAIADDALVLEQPGDFALAVFCDFARVKTVIGGAIVLALAENRVPAEAGLRALENQKLEQPTVIVKRDTPLAIVVGDLKVIVGPETPGRGLHASHNLAVSRNKGTRRLSQFKPGVQSDQGQGRGKASARQARKSGCRPPPALKNISAAEAGLAREWRP